MRGGLRWEHGIITLCSQRKQKEVSDILKKLGMNIVAGQESWEKVESAVVVSGYKWSGKPRKVKKNARGKRGVGVLVRDCLVEEVEFISKVCYEENLWMKVQGGRGRDAL